MKGHTWWREPLVHFLAIGALLFLVFNWRSGGAGSNRIVVTPGQIEAMAAGFARTWQRPPTSTELKGLLDEHVREQIATREAMAAGLDRDDTIIRRRLRQKLEFVAEDSIDATPPTDAQLQAWLEAHPESFRIQPSVAFRQVYLNPDRRGAAIEADGLRLLERLKAGILQELADASPRVSFEELTLVLEKDRAEQYGITDAPGLAVVRAAGDAVAWAPGIRFLGAPAGYEFMSLVEAIRLTASGESGLSDESRGSSAPSARPCTSRCSSHRRDRTAPGP